MPLLKLRTKLQVISLVVMVGQVVLSQTVVDHLWTTNAPVNAIQKVGNTIYLGGEFTQVGPSTGSGVAIDANTGLYDPLFPKVNGFVLAVEADGAGGWFIGGVFFNVGGIPRTSLAHIRPDKTVDPIWNPVVDGVVYSLHLDGSVLYVGGQFATLGGQPRRSCGALNASTGQVQPWNPDVNGTVFALAGTPTTVFVGGFFDTVSATAYQSLVEVNKSSGIPTGWNRPVNGAVLSFAISGQTVYVGGVFDMVAGTPRNNVAALTIGGAVTSWGPSVNSTVRDIIVSSGTVFLAGDFTTISQSSRAYVGSVGETSGAVLPFNPLPDQPVYDIDLSGNSLYMGGSFADIDGVQRNGLAQVDATTGAVSPWNPRANGDVYKSVLSGSTVYAGGFFTSVNGVDRMYLAAFDATTGAATNWNPAADAPVRDLFVQGNTVYVAGEFSTLGGLSRNLLGAVDGATGLTTSWNPLLIGFSVSTMKGFGSQLLIGGDFFQVGQSQRNSAAGIDMNTALPTVWDPNISGSIDEIVVHGGKTYLGGNFDVVGGAVRNFLAAVNLVNGAVLPWDPSPNAPVHSILPNGSSVFVGGTFTMLGNFPRTKLAEIDTSGPILPWAPSFTSVSQEEQVSTMALSGMNLYVGGDFTEVDLQQRLNLAAFHLPTRTLSPWAPITDLPVHTMIRQDSIVYIGGSFFYVGSSIYSPIFDVRSGFAGIVDQNLTPSITVTAPNGGEVWAQGSSQGVTWTSNSAPAVSMPPSSRTVSRTVGDNVDIDISRDNGQSYTTIVINAPNLGLYNWTVDGPATSQALIRVSSTNNPSIQDVSDGPFTISGASFVASPDSLDFGLVAVGSTSQMDMVVRNPGTSALTISSIVAAAPFSITPGNATIAPGDSSVFSVRFAPLVATPYVGTMLFNHDGTGSPAVYRVRGIGATGTFAANPLLLSFGVVAVDSTKSDTVRVTNIGTNPLVVSSVVSTATEFTVSPTSISISPSATVPFVVSFRPPSVGLHAGSIVFTHNGATGVDSVAVTGVGASPQILLSPTSVAFGSLPVGSRIGATVTAINVGTIALHISSVSISGSDSTEFRILGGSGPFPPLAVGDSVQFQLEFAPVSVGAKSSTLGVVSNAGSSPNTVALVGNATASPVQPLVVGDTTLGNSLGLRVTLPAIFTLLTDTLYFRNGGQTSYMMTNFQRSGNTLDVTFPQQYINIRGIEYHLALSVDSAGSQRLLTFPDINPEMNPAILRVRASAVTAGLLMPPSKYRMVSVPLELSNPQPAVVLSDDYGPYQTSVWRLFRWENNGYNEYQQIQAGFRGGNAFWLITASGTPFTAQDGLSTDSRNTQTMSIPPGFSQISNPFAFPVAWDSVTNSSLLSGLTGYDGDQYVPGVQLMLPWEGYFVFNGGSSNVIVSVPAVQSPPGLGKLFSSGDYSVQFAGWMEGTSYVDSYNYVGFVQGATAGEDRNDFREPPVIHEQLVVSVVDEGTRYLTNFKPLNSDGVRWDVEVRSSVPGRPISCRLAEHGFIPDGFRLFVIDRDLEQSIADPTRDFTVNVPASGVKRRFTVLIGTEEYARQNADGIPLAPISFALEQNYPNPFNPSTTIRFQMAKRAHVTLAVFDLLGRKIATLVDEVQGTGMHTSLWKGLDESGTPVSSGVYLYQLRTDEFSATKKLILLR